MARAPQYEFNTAPLLEWREPVGPGRVLNALTVSIAIHIVAFGIYLVMPDPEYRFLRRVDFTSDLTAKSIPLVAPRIEELTQREPSDVKAKQQLDITSALPPARTPRAFRPPGPIGGPKETEKGPHVLAEAPELKIDLGVPEPPSGPLAATPAPILVPPRAILENIGPSIPRDPSPTPNTPVSAEEAARAASKAGGGGLGAPGAPGEPSSLEGMQLLSDPQGVDFKPYLTQVLATVRRNWFAIIPAAAQTGRRGTAVVQFIINRRGQVPKLVIATPSGTSSYDRAAVAAVSASYPFNPLPSAYKGDEIRVQMVFTYNPQVGR